MQRNSPLGIRKDQFSVRFLDVVLTDGLGNALESMHVNSLVQFYKLIIIPL